MADAIDAIRGVLADQLGSAPDALTLGAYVRWSGPDERAGKRSCWCLAFEDGRGAVFGCWKRGIESSWQATRPENQTPAERAAFRRQIAEAKQEREREQHDAWRRNDDRNRHMARGARAVTVGDPVDLYLARRLNVDAFPVPACIRFHPAMPYLHEGKSLGTFPCMVVPLVDKSGRMLSLHRTYLTPDGRKADVPAVRKLSPASGLLSGASIPLHPPKSGAMGIAEGIETALGAWLASGVPVVAAYSAGNLAAYAWPGSVRRLVIFGDNDKVGSEAAQALQARAVAARLSVEVCIPEIEGEDWCDVWAQRGEATA